MINVILESDLGIFVGFQSCGYQEVSAAPVVAEPLLCRFSAK